MPEKNPLDNLIVQLGLMLDIFQSGNKPIEISSNKLLECLDDLEKNFSLFEELNAKFFQEANIDIEKLRREINQNKQLPEQTKQFHEKLKNIEQEARGLQQRFAKLAEKHKKKGGKNKDPDKQLIKQHRKKFKPLGGDKGWIPL